MGDRDSLHDMKNDRITKQERQEKLKKLKNLRDTKAISKEEFKKRKVELFK